MAQTVNIHKQAIEIKNNLGSWMANDRFIRGGDIEAFSFSSLCYQPVCSRVDAAEMCCDGWGGKNCSKNTKFILENINKSWQVQVFGTSGNKRIPSL